MDRHRITLGSFICLICFSVLLWSCDKPPEPSQQAKKVVKKIAVAPAADVKTPAKPQQTGTQKPVQQKEAAKEMPAAKPKVVQDPLKPAPAIEEKKPESTASAQPITGETPPLSDLYDPQGKLDPFEPLFQPKPVAIATKKRKARSVPPTPLERISLSQLKLVAVIRSPGENRALVQETTGKGYIVTAGTYIGLNGGKIVQILKNRIVIEEEVEDVYGKTTISKKFLQLQKSPGE